MGGLDIAQRILTWFYRKLGRSYPALFITAEVQSAWVIVIGTLALYNLYFHPRHSALVALLVLTLCLTAFTLSLALFRTYRYIRPMKRWIGGERGPESTSEAWSVAIGLPLEFIRRDFWFPIIGVALPVSVVAVVILKLSALALLPVFAGGLVAIGYSGILHYFALEAGMRPLLVDLNRVVSPRLHTQRRALPLRLKLMGALPMINIITGLVASALSGGNRGGGGAGLGFDVLVATGVAFTISFELSVLLSKSILRPMNDLGRAIEEVREGNLDVSVPVTTGDELGELSAAFNQMVAGLAERERIREAFGTYLDEEVATYILSDGYEPDGFAADVSVLFCDVRDFTGFAARAEAPQVVRALNRLFEVVVPIIARHGGHVDKFVGDGLLAVFGTPEPHRDHAQRAVRAAISIAKRVNHGPEDLLPVGIGVNSGSVVAGSIGGAGRLNFSVIGDVVNVAARVEAATRRLGEEILITEATRERLSSDIALTPRGSPPLKGRDEPIAVFAPAAELGASPAPGTTDSAGTRTAGRATE